MPHWSQRKSDHDELFFSYATKSPTYTDKSDMRTRKLDYTKTKGVYEAMNRDFDNVNWEESIFDLA